MGHVHLDATHEISVGFVENSLQLLQLSFESNADRLAWGYEGVWEGGTSAVLGEEKSEKVDILFCSIFVRILRVERNPDKDYQGWG